MSVRVYYQKWFCSSLPKKYLPIAARASLPILDPMPAGVVQVMAPDLASSDQGINSNESSSSPWPTSRKCGGIPEKENQAQLLKHITIFILYASREC